MDGIRGFDHEVSRVGTGLGSEKLDDDPPPLFANRAGARVGKIGIGTDFRADERVRWAESEQLSTLLQLVLPDSIGQETELADAD